MTTADLKRTTCDDHTYGPGGYGAWHEWAERMSQTHRQRRCDECGLWAIWDPMTSPDPMTSGCDRAPA